MGLFDSLTTLVTAPLEIVDTVLIKPVADLAQQAADDIKDTLNTKG